MVKACKICCLCVVTVLCWFLLSFHVVVQDGHVREGVGSGLYVSCMKIPGILAGDYFPSYDGLAFSEYVLSDVRFQDGQAVRVIRLVSWWSFWTHLENFGSHGHDALLIPNSAPNLCYVREPTLIVAID